MNIIAVKRNVHIADWDFDLFDLLDVIGNSVGEEITACPDADYHDVVGSRVSLDDLMRNAHQRALHLFFIQHL